MKRFSEQFNTKAKSVKMTMAEKRALRERVVSYMEYHPLAKASVPTPYREEIALPTFLQGLSWQKLKWAAPAILILVVGVTSLAENSVPGDALYAVKQVNEDLRGTMVHGSYEKVVWETELLNRRMAEARELASEGKLTEEVEATMAKAVQEHSENARKEIELLQDIDEDEATMAALELSTALSVQGSALQNQSAKSGDTQTTNLLAEVVEVETKAVEETTVDYGLPAYEKLVAKVETETTRARELLLSINDTATSEERSDVDRRLSDIDLKIVTAEENVGNDEIKAREEMVAVLEQTHKLIVFMTNIDVRVSLTVEEVVPVTLTEAERIENATNNVKEAEAILVKIEEVLTATTTDGVDLETLDKAQTAVDMIKAASLKVTEALALEPKAVATAEIAGLEANNLAKDTAKLLGIMGFENTVDESVIVPAPTTTEPEDTHSEEEITDEETEVETEPTASTTPSAPQI